MGLLAPDVVLAGRWRLEACIGAGGMGEVWRARHEVLGRTAAVKLLRDAIPTGRERLLQEARVLASVRHPAIVEVFDYGEHEQMPFYVMELLEGRTLGDRLRAQGPLAARAAVELIVHVLDGLEVAHAAGVVHRDVKPDNVFLVGERAKLVDFGVARVRGRAARFTVAGDLVGTPDYMAPEQIRGEDPDARADVWAAAITLYETITGRAPFESESLANTLHRVLHEAPERDARIDASLWAFLLGALEKPRERRFASARAFADALRSWVVREPTGPATLPAPPDPSDPLRGSLDAIIRGKLTPK